jgi:hypothetical protein
LSKLSRDRLQGVHPDLVRVVERAIQITTQDFRVQEGLPTRERQRKNRRDLRASDCAVALARVENPSARAL